MVKRIGVLGGGQLGRMLALAGYPLDLSFVFLDHAEGGPAAQVAPQITADFADHRALDALAARVDVVTYEWENVPVDTARYLAAKVPVFPPPETLVSSQDRLHEKQMFRALGVPTAPFDAVEDVSSLRDALDRVGLPAVLKTRRMGYDGKGQVVLRSRDQCEAAFAQIGAGQAIVEGWVPFTRELSQIAARGRDGEIVFYPLVEGHHEGGILRHCLAPAPNTATLTSTAQDYATRLLHRLDYVGVLALEMFEREGELVANEMAPRVHNSGHWTIEGAETSQFENHLRAIAGLPLGSCAPRGISAMVNFIGHVPSLDALARMAGLHVHLYGKAEKPLRKLGHATLCDVDRARLEARLDPLKRSL